VLIIISIIISIIINVFYYLQIELIYIIKNIKKSKLIKYFLKKKKKKNHLFFIHHKKTKKFFSANHNHMQAVNVV